MDWRSVQFRSQYLETMAAQTGASVEVNSEKSSSFSTNDPYGIGGFILGCFLIPFSLVLLWKNERKVVMYTRVIDQGRQEVRTVDCEKLDDANDF